MRYILVLAALALAACQPATQTTTSEDTLTDPDFSCANVQAAGEAFTFACDDGKTFSVGYDEAAVCAILTAGGETYRLPGAIAASGSRYQGDGVEFWEHQGEAMLDGAAGGPYGGCKAPAPAE